MFEQSSYEYQPVATPQQEGDLFHNYEIRTWTLSPRIYKILGLSALANVFALFIFGQTSLLTMKGCDSPLVGRVCQVLDTVYVGSMLWGSDREYVDAAYDKTDLGDADITFIDVSGVSPPLSYPEGYFQLANANELASVDHIPGDPFGSSSGIPGIPAGIPISPSSDGGIINTPPVFPTPNPSVDGGLPSGFDDNGASAVNPPIRRLNRRRNTSPGTKTDGGIPGFPGLDHVAEAKPSPTPEASPSAPVDPDVYNDRPLSDLGAYVNELIDKNLYKLDSQFIIRAKGKLNKDGRFDKKTFKFTNAQSSDQMTIDVLKKAIEAINDSGRLKVLTDLTGKDMNLTVSQDAANVNAVVESEVESEMRANSIKSTLQLAINFAKDKKSGEGADQNDKDDLVLLQNAKIETDGKRVIITFFAPKEILLPMLQRKLAEQKSKPKPQNGNTSTQGRNNSGKG